MIHLEEGIPTLCGRVTCGYEVGWITWVGPKTYRIKWRDGYTEQLRPDVLDNEEEYQFAPEEIA